jgi:hypothetical protein
VLISRACLARLGSLCEFTRTAEGGSRPVSDRGIAQTGAVGRLEVEYCELIGPSENEPLAIVLPGPRVFFFVIFAIGDVLLCMLIKHVMLKHENDIEDD